MPDAHDSGAAASRKTIPYRSDRGFAGRADRGGAVSVRPTPLPRADAKVEQWLAQMGAEPEADGLRQVFAAAPKARDLIAGLFAYSPYLWDLVVPIPIASCACSAFDPDSAVSQPAGFRASAR